MKIKLNNTEDDEPFERITPARLGVRTRPFHGRNTSSILVRVTSE